MEVNFQGVHVGIEQEDPMRKSFKAGCVRMAEYFLIPSFSVWVALHVVHSLCSGGVPPVIMVLSSNSVWIWNTLFTLLIGRSTEFAHLYPCTPPNLNKVILINISYPFTFIILPKLFPYSKEGPFLTVTSSVL